MCSVEGTGFEPVTTSDFQSECAEPEDPIRRSIRLRAFQLLISFSRNWAATFVSNCSVYTMIQSLARPV